MSAAKTELARLDARREELLKEIKELEGEQRHIRAFQEPSAEYASVCIPPIDPKSDKIHLFRSLFRGREDVFPRRFESKTTEKSGYQPACRNEWMKGVCGKPKAKCADCEKRDYIPLSDEIIKAHLEGKDPFCKYDRDFVIGVYPLSVDETCWFLAADFDKDTWIDDVRAFSDTCKSNSIPAYIERSRSGNGGHAWIFFSESIPAVTARKLGSFLLTAAMDKRPEIGFRSYDRFFPNQDTMPRGGFGNLIALPLQKRRVVSGNSVFLDENFNPFRDQWAFLETVQRVSGSQVFEIVDRAVRQGMILGVRFQYEDEEDRTPWKQTPSRKQKAPSITGPFPQSVTIVLGNQLYIPKKDLSPALRNRVIRIAAFQNPEFYRAQAMRFPVYNKPRIISCCQDFPDHFGIPRGCMDEVIKLFSALGITVDVQDERNHGIFLNVEFNGCLKFPQEQAAASLLKEDFGVLSATTAFGKTVVAIYLLAQRKTSTLILVHRQQLLDQWIERLQTFLHGYDGVIGQIGGGKKEPTGKIDVAIIQSLIRKGEVDDIVANYGYLIVDECHHISAVSFEQVARLCKARYVTGLSATLSRKDGHHPIIFMQCGPVRFHVDEKKESLARPFNHRVIIRKTAFVLPERLKDNPDLLINDVYSALMQDVLRNQTIVSDVLACIQNGRTPLILSERTEHVEELANLLSPYVSPIVLTGSLSKKERASRIERFRSAAATKDRVLVATGKYLGEGFDDERLDTLFLTLPVSWKGTIVQYAGRLHRLHGSKEDVIIYDYFDCEVPILSKMFERRRKSYKSIGYAVEEEPLAEVF